MTDLPDRTVRVTRLVVVVLIVLVAVIPLATWLGGLGNPLAYWSSQIPVGQTAYLFSKLFALYAFAVFSVQMMVGLISGLPGHFRQAFHWQGIHRVLAAFLLVTIVLHIGLFVGAASARMGHFAADYVTPSFSHGYYRSRISLGIFALALVVVSLAGRLLRVRHAVASLWLHRLVAPAYLLVVIHSLSIGSETRMGLMPLLYGVLLTSIVVVLVRRAWSGREQSVQTELSG